jgi:hypothetical protein
MSVRSMRFLPCTTRLVGVVDALRFGSESCHFPDAGVVVETIADPSDTVTFSPLSAQPKTLMSLSR